MTQPAGHASGKTPAEHGTSLPAPLKRIPSKAERDALVTRAKTLHPDAFTRVLAACSADGLTDAELHAARIVLAAHGGATL